MNIGLDLDGVLYNWMGAVHVELENFYGYEKSFAEFITSFQEVENILRYLMDVPILYGMSVPSKVNLDFIRTAKIRGHSIFYITARPKTVKYTTETWLDRYEFPDIDNLIFTKNKPLELLKYDISFYVDDRIHEFVKASRVCPAFLYSRPYNRSLETKYRINNLQDLSNLI